MDADHEVPDVDMRQGLSKRPKGEASSAFEDRDDARWEKEVAFLHSVVEKLMEDKETWRKDKKEWKEENTALKEDNRELRTHNMVLQERCLGLAGAVLEAQRARSESPQTITELTNFSSSPPKAVRLQPYSLCAHPRLRPPVRPEDHPDSLVHHQDLSLLQLPRIRFALILPLPN